MLNTEIVERINSVLCGEPFNFRPAKEPFSFDLQPNQLLDRVCCLTIEGQQTDGYLGPYAAQIDRVEVFVAKKIRLDVHARRLELMTDCNSLVSAIFHDSDGVDYSAELQGWTVPEPEEGADFVVGMVEFAVDYDRAL